MIGKESKRLSNISINKDMYLFRVSHSPFTQETEVILDCLVFPQQSPVHDTHGLTRAALRTEQFLVLSPELGHFLAVLVKESGKFSNEIFWVTKWERILPSKTQSFLVQALVFHDHVIVPSSKILSFLKRKNSIIKVFLKTNIYLSIVVHILESLV